MDEIILNIEELDNVGESGRKDYDPDRDRHAYGYDGFKITTNKQEILLLIDNHQSCCERWGIITSEDLEYPDTTGGVIGEKLLGVTVIVGSDYNSVNIPINTEFLKNTEYCAVDIEEAVFINLKTSKKDIQFAVYNSHNGYYGHMVRIKCKKFTRLPENTEDSFEETQKLTWI